MLNFVNPHLPRPGYMVSPSISDITDLIIHHTAGSLEQTIHDIDLEHRNIGDAMIAYNFIIDPKIVKQANGKLNIMIGRPVEFIPAATFGRNPESVNISVIGQYDSNYPGFSGNPNPDVIQALKEFALWAHLRWPSICRTIGHRDVAPMFYPNNQSEYSTACPGDRLYVEIPAIKSFVHAKVLAR